MQHCGGNTNLVICPAWVSLSEWYNFFHPFSYQYNFAGTGTGGAVLEPGLGLGYLAPYGANRPVPDSRVVSPSDMLAIGDIGDTRENLAGETMGGGSGGPGRSVPITRIGVTMQCFATIKSKRATQETFLRKMV